MGQSGLTREMQKPYARPLDLRRCRLPWTELHANGSVWACVCPLAREPKPIDTSNAMYSSIRFTAHLFFFCSDSRVPRKCSVRQSKYNTCVPCENSACRRSASLRIS